MSFSDSGGPEQPEVLLEIRRIRSGTVELIKLTGGRLVIGRNAGLPIQLDDESVSRLHAELVSDLYERWWIHDLGSTNGTFVNGNPVSRRMLHMGDKIQIGDYSLQLRMPGTFRQIAATDPPPPIDERAPATTRFATTDLGVKLSAAHLASATEFNRELLHVETRSVRSSRLCEYVVRPQFPTLCAWVVRIEDGQSPRLQVNPMPAGAGSRIHDRRALETLINQHEEALRVHGGAQIFDLAEIGGGMVVAHPLERQQRSIDVLYVEFPRSCNLEQWPDLITLLAEGYQQANELWAFRANLRRGAEIDHEFRMAQIVQSKLIPRSPNIEGLELAIGYEPCQWVGGDYVDAVPMSDGRVLLVVADVCGKGLQAALVASSLYTFVHVLVESPLSLAQLAKRMNRHLHEILPEGSFVTMVCVAVEPLTGELECVNAGHPPAFVADSNGNVRQLQSKKNFALGMMDLEPVSEMHRMMPGDVLLLYTDGMTEAEDSRRDALGIERLMAEFGRIVSSLPDANLDTMSRRISATIKTYRGSLMATDDTTFLMARPDPMQGLLQLQRRSMSASTLFPPPSSRN